MATPQQKKSAAKKVLIGLLAFIVIAGVAFHIYITRYLPQIVQKRLSAIIVNGSDSLYQLEMGKFDLSFWGGSIYFEDLHITVDSARYRLMKAENRLPPMSCELLLRKGRVNGIGLGSLIISKKIEVREIVFDSADLQLARHFGSAEEVQSSGQPLWKLIQPKIKAIHIGSIYCADLKIKYKNVDSAAAFKWEFEKSDLLLSDVRVDSTTAHDSTRLMFAKDLAFTAKNVQLATTDGLYNLKAGDLRYSSSTGSVTINRFDFLPAISDHQFGKQFGYQHEIYRINVPVIGLKNFSLAKWITHNKFTADNIDLSSPQIAVYMDRNLKPNTVSKKGGYPQQLLQKLPFLVNVRQLNATDASVVYTEKSNLTNLPGKVSFIPVSGVITNITNDPEIIRSSAECVATVSGSAMGKGKLNAVFRFNLADKRGAFTVKSTITQLDANQLRPVFSAMTAVEMQSFSMKRLDYTINGNEDAGTGTLSMKYDDMDILINRVEPDKSFDRKGFLSFLANRLIIYKENPMNGEERKATAVVVQRDATRSFFNLVWKTMFASASEIVLRPMAQRKMERKKERLERRQERQNAGKK